MIRKKMHILSNTAKFSAIWPLLPAYNFSAMITTTYSTYHLGGCGLPKIFGD